MAPSGGCKVFGQLELVTGGQQVRPKGPVLVSLLCHTLSAVKADKSQSRSDTKCLDLRSGHRSRLEWGEAGEAGNNQ